MFAELYERKARECLRLMRGCNDPTTLEMLRCFVDAYAAQAVELRRNGQTAAPPVPPRAPESRWRAALAQLLGFVLP
jgi:hypothetical protein